MPRNKEKTISRPAADQQVWDAVADGTAADLKELQGSSDENVLAAYDDFAERVADLNDSQLASGQQLLAMGKRNPIAGNLMAASEVFTHGKNAKDAAMGVWSGGSWVVGKLGNLIG